MGAFRLWILWILWGVESNPQSQIENTKKLNTDRLFCIIGFFLPLGICHLGVFVNLGYLSSQDFLSSWSICHPGVFFILGYLSSWIFVILGYLSSWGCRPGVFVILGLSSWGTCHPGLFVILGYLSSWGIGQHGVYSIYRML